MDKQIKTLSKEEFYLYASKRKPLDKEFTKMTINRFEEKRKDTEQKIETRKREHKEKMETDEAYRNAYKEKMKKAYEKAKLKREQSRLKMEQKEPEKQPEKEEIVFRREHQEVDDTHPKTVIGVFDGDLDDLYDF